MKGTPKFYKELLVGISHTIGLEGARQNQGTVKIVFNFAEIFTKLLSFSDVTQSSSGNKADYTSVIGATGIAVASTIDDIMINCGFYKNHHIAKLGCALYGAYRVSNHNDINYFTPKSDTFTKTALLTAGLYSLSYAFGSCDMINLIRSNTKDCIDFAEKVNQMSDETVNPYYDMQAASVIGGIFGGVRQFSSNYDLEMGAALNGVVGPLTTTLVGLALSSHSQVQLKNTFIDKFQYSLEKVGISGLEKLKSDMRAQKILEDLPNYISKASNNITKISVNSSLKTAYEQILAGFQFSHGSKTNEFTHDDAGLSIFVATNLFNRSVIENVNGKINKKINTNYDFKNLVHKNDSENIYKHLNEIKASKPSHIESIFDCAKKAFNSVVPVLINGIFINTMHNHEAKWNNPSSYKSLYMPLVTTLGIGESFVDSEAYEALYELEYLLNKLEAAY